MPFSYLRRLVLLIVMAAPIAVFAQGEAASPAVVAVETVTGSEPLRDGIQIQAGAAILRITALRDDVIRVRIAPTSSLPEDASWAVLGDARGKSVRSEERRVGKEC